MHDALVVYEGSGAIRGGRGSRRRRPTMRCTLEDGAPRQKGQPGWAALFVQVVPEIGVEPTTFALRMRCSTN